MQKQGKKLTEQEATERIRRYCAYQERSHSEVRNKLFSFGLYGDQVDQILTNLLGEGFLNEERFSKAFAGGKFRMKKWGRIKITNALEQKGVTRNCIASGLKEIDDEHYRKTLEDLLEKKYGMLAGQNEFVRKEKAAEFAIRKGFEPDLVWQILKSYKDR